MLKETFFLNRKNELILNLMAVTCLKKVETGA